MNHRERMSAIRRSGYLVKGSYYYVPAQGRKLGIPPGIYDSFGRRASLIASAPDKR